jgi:hypothetical protein
MMLTLAALGCAGASPPPPRVHSPPERAAAADHRVRGLGAEALHRVLRTLPQRVLACYRARVGEVPPPRGRITLRWRIAPAGHVETATLVRSTLENPNFERCFVEEARDLAFPAFDEEDAVVATIPFIVD